MKSLFHHTAIIDNGAEVGKNTKIWHWTHISSGARVGENCSIGQNVYIGSKARVGNNVKIQNNVSIYDNVTIEDNVFCGPSVVFTNVINPRSEISRKSEYKKTIVKSGASLGANSTIICGIEIGQYAFIGAGALVNKDVKSFALVLGIPAIQKGWMTAYGDRINIDLDGESEWVCSKTRDKYFLLKDNLIRKKGEY